MGLYGPIEMLWNGGADQLKFPADQLKLHGYVHFTKETCVCGFKMSKKWSFGPIRNDARPIVAAGRPRMVAVVFHMSLPMTTSPPGSSSTPLSSDISCVTIKIILASPDPNVFLPPPPLMLPWYYIRFLCHHQYHCPLRPHQFIGTPHLIQRLASPPTGPPSLFAS